MSAEVRALEPKGIWNHFADLNEVPRASKKEERVIQFMKDFGARLGLETHEDAVGNVLIRKPASVGMEDRQTIVMQSHLDMVHQKNADVDFDFDTEGIKMYVDGDWVKAQGTTLGADNGLGVATIMTILASDDIAHPPIEALFTIDEETGMTGALGLQPGWLKGKILLNLDTEEDDEIGVGCAGGIDFTASMDYQEIDAGDDYTTLKISVTGLNGGHSGMDIDKGLGNANKTMNRILYTVAAKHSCFRIHSITGGSLRNAIPRESFATVLAKNEHLEDIKSMIRDLAGDIKKELHVIDPNLSIEISSSDPVSKVIDPVAQQKILQAIYAAHNGVYRMSPSIADLVEASNNVAKVTVVDGRMEVLCLTRSSVESSKWDVVNNLSATFGMIGADVATSGDYPGWAPDMGASILKVLDESYQRLFNEKAHIAACHAGLECGIIGSHYPGMEMISFGPTIKGAHSPDERACISSTQKYWSFVLDILKHTPKA